MENQSFSDYLLDFLINHCLQILEFASVDVGNRNHLMVPVLSYTI